MGTSLNWLREARGYAGDEIVRVVLLAPTSGFPAGYVGMLDSENFDIVGPNDSIRIVMYNFSLLDDNYNQRIAEYDQTPMHIEAPTADVWPVLEDVDLGPTTPTLTKLNAAAITLASNLITDAEYHTMRIAILSNQ